MPTADSRARRRARMSRRWVLAAASIWTAACAAACGAPSSAPVMLVSPAPPVSHEPDERVALLADALHWWVPRVLGARELSNWILVVDAGAESQKVVERMRDPAYTVVMPPDIETGPISITDRRSGCKVIRFSASIIEVTDSSAFVNVAYDCGQRCGGGCRVELEPTASEWRVVFHEDKWRN